MWGCFFMKKCVSLILAVLLIMPVRAAEKPAVSAKSAVLIEYQTGKVLYAKNADKQLPMASTTKIMTALLALEEGNLEDMVTISRRAANVEGSSMYLREGEKISLSDLLIGLMLSSGNDAAIAIAEHIAGDEGAFAVRMTEKAKEMGCINTQFKNASGLPDDEHYTTALELALITGKALENEKFREIVSTKSAKAGGRTLSNHNKMLSLYEGAIGVKTGFTKKAGRTLVSAANRGGVELIAVTLNAPDDWTDHTNILNYGFSQMERRQIVAKGDRASSVSVLNGAQNKSPVLFAEDVFLSVLKTAKTEMKYSVRNDISAPIEKGEEVGRAEIFLDGVKMGETPLIIGESVPCAPKPSLWEYVFFAFRTWASMYVLTT